MSLDSDRLPIAARSIRVSLDSDRLPIAARSTRVSLDSDRLPIAAERSSSGCHWIVIGCAFYQGVTG